MTRSLAARIYDQDTHSETDLAYLDTLAKADREWHEALRSANLTFGGGSDAWLAVKNLATRQRDKARADALAVYEAADIAEELFAQAAE